MITWAGLTIKLPVNSGSRRILTKRFQNLHENKVLSKIFGQQSSGEKHSTS